MDRNLCLTALELGGLEMSCSISASMGAALCENMLVSVLNKPDVALSPYQLAQQAAIVMGYIVMAYIVMA